MSRTSRSTARRAFALAAAAVLAATAAGGCSSSSSSEAGGGGSDRVVTVLAAASLSGPFTELAERFEAEHEGVEVRLSFGGSSDLVAQVQQGAPADVVATADEATMEQLSAEDLVAPPELSATNTLTVAVPPGNPAGVASLADLTDAAEVALVVCAPEVPCGAAAQRLAEAAGVELAPVSEEQSVTDVLGKVVSGEADAGLVYVTDVAAAGDDVEAVEVPEAAEVVNRYPVAAVDDAPAGDLAQDFVDLVLSDEGQEVLAAAGFGAP